MGTAPQYPPHQPAPLYHQEAPAFNPYGAYVDPHTAATVAANSQYEQSAYGGPQMQMGMGMGMGGETALGIGNSHWSDTFTGAPTQPYYPGYPPN